jgi:hypothetical protein
MKLRNGRRLYNETKPEKAHVLSPGFSQHELCGTNLYMSVCSFALIKDVCQKCEMYATSYRFYRMLQRSLTVLK